MQSSNLAHSHFSLDIVVPQQVFTEDSVINVLIFFVFKVDIRQKQYQDKY